MGVMKRLYARDGKGLPTDGPTVLRAPGSPRAPRAAKANAATAPESKPAPWLGSGGPLDDPIPLASQPGAYYHDGEIHRTSQMSFFGGL